MYMCNYLFINYYLIYVNYDEVYKVYKCLYDEISSCSCDKDKDNNGIAFIEELIENETKYNIKDINDVKLMKVNYVYNNSNSC